MSTDTPTVVVAGMGPVGMVAALALARQGIAVTVLEAGADLADESRASTFHPSSLEYLDELGVASELMASGLKAPAFQFRLRSGQVIAHLDMSLLAADTRFPFRIQNEQGVLTRIIRRHLKRMPHVTLRYEAPIERLELGRDCAYLFLPGDARTPSYRADWLIAADGAGSASRRSLGIAFEGVTYPERFLVASTTYDFREAFENLAYVSYIYDPVDWGVLLRTPRHWRVLFPVDASETDDMACDPARVEARLQGVAPLDHPYPLEHRTIYKVHQRLAARFGLGRVMLAGDAAHINNPLGGLGMNSGIQDAQAAVAAISFALQGGDPQRAVDTYARVRRDAAVNDVQQQTQRNYDAMRDGDAARAADRKAQMAALAADPRKARAYLRKTSMLASFETSRRRMRRALSPTRPGASLPAGQRLSDLISEAALLYPDHVLRQLPDAVRETTDVVRFVTEAERDDVAAIVFPSLGCKGGGDERIAAAHRVRRDVLLIGMVDAANVRAAVAAGAGLVEAGADLIGLDGRLDLGTVTAIHEGLREVPLALVGPDRATLPTDLDLTLAGVGLVIARPPVAPSRSERVPHDQPHVA